MSEILVIAEHRTGQVREVSAELITAAANMAPDMGADVGVGVIASEPKRFIDDLNLPGVDTVYAIESGGDETVDGDGYNHSTYVECVVSLVSETEPDLVVMPHTITGLDFAPAVATQLDVPLMTNAVDLEYEESVLVSRKMYESKVETTIRMPDEPSAVTLRSGSVEPATGEGDASVVEFDPGLGETERRSKVIDVVTAETGDTDITKAEFIVSIGLGIEEEENVDLIRNLCEAADATLAASRPVVELGWVDKDRQVGQSGSTVKPSVYIAIGISGAIEHVVGMKGSDVVVAINNDPDAPIFDVADYGIVADLFDVVPALVDEFE